MLNSIKIILLILLFSCGIEKSKKLQKPFIIVRKEKRPNFYQYYIYQDSNGVETKFYDDSKDYNIGDTLK